MIEVYGKTGCSGCIQAKQLLDGKGIEYEYKQLGQDYSLQDFYTVAPKTCRNFPMIAQDGEYIGGLAELKQLLA